MWVVIGTNTVSCDGDDELETRSSEFRFWRGLVDLADFSEPRAEVTSDMDSLSSLRLFFRKRLVGPDRMLNVLLNFSVKEGVRDGDVGRPSVVGDSAGDSTGDPIDDSASVSGVGDREVSPNRFRRPRRGERHRLGLGLGLRLGLRLGLGLRLLPRLELRLGLWLGLRLGLRLGRGLGVASFTIGSSAEPRDGPPSLAIRGNSIHSLNSSWIVEEEAVAASPESLFHGPSAERVVPRLRNSGCSSCGGGGKGGGTTTRGVSETEGLMVEGGRGAFGRLLGAGRGIGSSACFVCSYRTPTRFVSSRNGVMRATGLVL